MAKKTQKKDWKSGKQYNKGKRAGVKAVLEHSVTNSGYRSRLLDKDHPQDVITAFNEKGNFNLPAGFRVECFEREGVGVKPELTDDVVMLVLPKAAPGSKTKDIALKGHWNCTYLPYENKKKKKDKKHER